MVAEALKLCEVLVDDPILDATKVLRRRLIASDGETLGIFMAAYAQALIDRSIPYEFALEMVCRLQESLAQTAAHCEMHEDEENDAAPDRP